MNEQPDPTNLVRVTDDQWVELREEFVARLSLLLRAYRRGMVVARNDDEGRLISQIESLLGPPQRPGPPLDRS